MSRGFFYFFVLVSLWTVPAKAQRINTDSLSTSQNYYHINLEQKDSAHGLWILKWEAPAKLNDSLVIHLPLEAYIYNESFLNQQLRDFQDPDLHFAHDKDLAHFEITQAQLNGEKLETILKGEFLHIPLNGISKINLELHFNFRLPDAKFTGNGRLKEATYLINLLPRKANFENGNWELNPVTYNFDTHLQAEKFDVSILIGPGLDIVSNLKVDSIQTKKELGSFHFTGTAKDLQFFIAKEWVSVPLKRGGFLHLPSADANFEANFNLALEETESYFKSETNNDFNFGQSYIFLDEKEGEFQSAHLISLKRPKDWLDLRYDLIQAKAESYFRCSINTNGWSDPWIARGLPYFYKYHFIELKYPQKRWIPFENQLLNGLFAFDEFDYAYQNSFLFLFLQRQGLDQSLSAPVDSLSRLNYEAISQAKAYLHFSHLRAFLGKRDFKRSMAYFVDQEDSKLNSKSLLRSSLQYYSPKNVDWFFNEGLHSAGINDYQLANFESCPTVTAALVINKGEVALPFSLTGYKDGKAIITEWFEGHRGKRSVQMMTDDYDKVVLNDHLKHSEYRQKNNTYHDRLVLPRMERLSFQLYNSFENPNTTQVFYVPSVFYNAYDQILLGVNLSNRSLLVQKPFEYIFVPEYSTGTGKMAGVGSLVYNWTTPKNKFFRQVSFGLFGRYNHYDRDLALYRISPSINFRIRKPYARSPYIQAARLRGVIVNRELANNFIGDANDIATASYTVLNANYRLEYTSLLKPTIFRFHIELAEGFGKTFAEYDQRWMLPNKKWLIWRGFAGVFLYNDLADQGYRDNFYSFGLSGTPDYLFDYYFIGRSDESGIWSRQFFTTDGGLKSETNAFADRFLLSTNLSVPLIGPLGVFGDIAVSEERLYWDYGLRLALITDFVELYLPLQNQQRNFYEESNYLGNVRFVLDLKLGSIINRVRRAYY